LPTVYALRGKRKGKEKEIIVQIVQRKFQKIPTHDTMSRVHPLDLIAKYRESKFSQNTKTLSY
jgi:hypothetical protein